MSLVKLSMDRYDGFSPELRAQVQIYNVSPRSRNQSVEDYVAMAQAHQRRMHERAFPGLTRFQVSAIT